LNLGLSLDFSVQLKVSLSERLSERLSQKLKSPIVLRFAFDNIKTGVWVVVGLWLSGNALVSINVVSLHGPVNIWMGDRLWAGKPSWYNQSPRSTQRFILPVSIINEYRQYAGVKV